MLEKRFLLIGAALPFIMLSGCSIGQSNEDKSIPIEKIDMSRYESQTVEGVFQGVLNKKFVDIKINGELKMFYANEDATKQLEELKEGDNIRFVYALSEKTGQNELQSIIQLNGADIAPEVEQKPAKDKLVKEKDKDKDVKKVEMEVEYSDRTKIVEAIESEFYEGKFKAIDSYEWDGEKLSNENTEIKFEKVEDTIEDDVQKERWRAADILKESGELKEEKDSSRGEQDVKFVFYTKADVQYKEIMVIKNKYGYFRVETETVNKERKDVISEVTAMLESIE